MKTGDGNKPNNAKAAMLDYFDDMFGSEVSPEHASDSTSEQKIAQTSAENQQPNTEQKASASKSTYDLLKVSQDLKKYTEDKGYGVVRELVGHGLGKVMHEDPQVPNYGKQGRGKKIQEGLVIAIEPMINMGTHRVKQLPDGWNIVTEDGQYSAHFEHDVAVVNGKPEILSTFDYIYEALGLPKDNILATSGNFK